MVIRFLMNVYLLILGCFLSGWHVKRAQLASFSVEASVSPSSCFEKFVGKLDKMLTREDVLSIYPSVSGKAEYKYSLTGPVEYHSCMYQWDSERTSLTKVGSREIQVPKPNKIGIGNLSFYGDRIKDPLAYFSNAHRTPTAEEKAEMQKRMKEKMKEKGLTTSQKETGTNLTVLLSDQISYTTIGGLGDAAVWDHMDNALVILAGRAKFKVYVEISGNMEENQGLAIKLAKRILAKCD